MEKPAKMAGFPGLAYEKLLLVLGDFGNSSHGAFLEALAASDASVLIHDLGDTAGNLQNLLRAGVYANTAADAFVFSDNGMGHDALLLFSALPLILSAVQDTIVFWDCKPHIPFFGRQLHPQASKGIAVCQRGRSLLAHCTWRQ